LTALEALARLKNLSGFARIAYVLAGPIGDRGYAEEILRHAGSLGVRCLLTGRLEEGDLRRLYRTSLCHVLSAVTMPGKIEGFGLVILEAAAQGCPTVASRVGGIPEVVADGGTGYLCGEKDVEGIASRMAALIQDRGLRETMSLRAHDHARGFTWLKCVQTIYNGKIALDAGGE
jgi:phosphatidylinositol alpha-1,6-mannosyltransferase